MTACMSDARLAAAASGEDPVAAAHAETCPRCARIVGEHGELVALARALPPPRFSSERRMELAAEVVAAAVVPDRRSAMPVILGIAALAAIVALVISQLGQPRAPVRVATPTPPAPAPIVTPIPTPAPAEAPAPPRPAHEGQAIEMHQVIDAVVRIPDTVTELVVKTSVIAAHQRFAPATSKTATTIERDEWQPTPDPTGASLAAFRDGWEALRAGRNTDAVAAFDRATDPIVAEDASYWAAIAAQRADDHADAQRRLRAFLDRFPASPRADDARAALDP